MRTLEKGFGICSLRESTIACLIIFVVVNVLGIVGVLAGYGNGSFIEGILGIIFAVIFIAVYGYTLYTLQRNDPSMLNAALIALIIHITFIILGLLFSIFKAIFSLSTYFIVLPYIAFEIYAAWIIYSYSIEFNQPVSVNA